MFDFYFCIEGIHYLISGRMEFVRILRVLNKLYRSL
nr:MAG TPA: hypothetical protein [Caudoviricetes sp.]